MPTDARLDCKHYLGDRPCAARRTCEGCDAYLPMGTRIAVIKLAAPGDVLRATAILPPLRRIYPESHVTWVADRAALPLVALNPCLDRVMEFGFETALILGVEAFDVAICLDKEPRAGALLKTLRAGVKRGFHLSESGTIEPLNEGAAYDLALGLSDELKFRVNTKSYPEIACGVAGLPYEGDPYVLALPDDSVAGASRFLAALGGEAPLVGLVAGAGSVFANKSLPPARLASLARAVRADLGGTPIVLGGPADRATSEEVLRLAEGAALDGGLHDVLEYAALVGMLDAVVTGDTMALHVAVALGVPVVAVFGPTAPQEIDLFGNGRKVIARVDCAPCYRRSCDRTPSCMDRIDVGEILTAVRDVLRES